MLGLVPLASLLLVAGEVELNATVTAETRAGQAPLRANEDPRAGVIGVLTPMGDLLIRQSDLEFRLEYGPRIFWRWPNLASRVKPLVLHVGNLTLATRLTPTLSLTGGSTVSAGEVDYSLLPQLVGSVQASLPTVASLLVATGRLGIDLQVTRLTRVGLALEASHRRPLGEVDPTITPGAAFLQRQSAVQAAPNMTVRLSRQDDVSFATAVAYRWFESGTNFLSVTPQAGWRRRLSATDEFRLSAGVTYGHVRYAPNTPTPSGALAAETVSPVGSAEVGKLLLRHRSVALQGVAGAMVDYYVDPILTLAQKRVTVTARLLLSLRDRWTAGIETALGTSIEPLAAPGGMGTPPDATYASVTVPIRHRPADNVFLEFGGQWADRAPHTESSVFGFHQRQLWLYAMVTLTTREVPRWVMPEGGDSDRRNRRPPQANSQGAPTPAATSRVQSRSTERVTGATGAGTGLPAPGSAIDGDQLTGVDRPTDVDSVLDRESAAGGGVTPGAPSVPGQRTPGGRDPYDEEEESETQRERELPNQSQLPIGIGGVR